MEAVLVIEEIVCTNIIIIVIIIIVLSRYKYKFYIVWYSAGLENIVITIIHKYLYCTCVID